MSDPGTEVETLREDLEMARAQIEIMRLNLQLCEEEIRQLTAHLESQLQSRNRERQWDEM